MQAWQTVAKIQKLVAAGMEIIAVSYGNPLLIILSGCTNRNAMAMGSMRLADGSHKSMINDKARRYQIKHTDEVETEAV